jgi:glycosyltransferase involved in cell wall biosynthesis
MRSTCGPALNYAVLVPAFEPDARLPAIVTAVAAGLPRAVVVVDDGSSAGSAVHFQGLHALERVVVLHHGGNRGKGAAIKTGLRCIRERYPDAAGVVTADADGQHTPEDILKVGDHLLRRRDSLILGERSLVGDVPVLSRAGNALTKMVFNLATGLRLSDTQTGLRGIPPGLVPDILRIDGSRYEFELDVLFLCRERGVPIVGVDIKTVYIDGNGSSHFRPVRDSVLISRRLLGHLTRLLWRERRRRAR